ncbi:MAG: 3-dehydroquinate synthase [Betaproteobacteria bacterium]|nr:MAG: 3-dehydroquinate synthase [Betaproteobacteria bacterium]
MTGAAAPAEGGEHSARADAGAPQPPSAEQALDQLLRGAWIDPDSGRATGVAIQAIAIEPTLDGEEADRVAALALGRRFAVVSDATTRRVLGERVERALRAVGAVEPVVLPGAPHADAATVARVRAWCAAADALVAVGSGTINDLAKAAAAADGKPYVVFPTAPSMNGYTSANAAITVDGHKKTLPAVLARGVFVDLEVLAAAPPRMIRAGLGDSLCRSTAQVDWLLSHHLLGTPYRRAPFALLAGDEAALLDGAGALLAGDRDAMRLLARTLLLSGLGMTLCGGSQPASQGEHLISHYVDMRAAAGREPSLHGEQVAVATLTMARLQESMLAGAAPVLAPTRATAADLERHFGAALGASCWREFEGKRLDGAGAAAMTARLAKAWPALRRDADAARVPAARLEAAMRRAGGPLRAADIGVGADFYAAAVRHARFLRDRYTFLDLADDAGVLEAAGA